jgi:hypothetical protein
MGGGTYKTSSGGIAGASSSGAGAPCNPSGSAGTASGGSGFAGNAGNAASFGNAGNFGTPPSTEVLSKRFEQRRQSVSDPQRLIAIELQNISDALLEVLKILKSR